MARAIGRGAGYLLCALALALFVANLWYGRLAVIGPLLLLAVGGWLLIGPAKVRAANEIAIDSFHVFLSQDAQAQRLEAWARASRWGAAALGVIWVYSAVAWLGLYRSWLVVAVMIAIFAPSIVLEGMVQARYRRARHRRIA